MGDPTPPVVAILNSSDDTVEMLRFMLEAEGMVAVSAHVDAIRRGQFDFSAFVAEHDPEVVIYDLSPPYDRTWLFLQHLKGLSVMQGRQFVLTSTNPERVRQIAGTDADILEVVGKPYDMQLIVDAVKAALR